MKYQSRVIFGSGIIFSLIIGWFFFPMVLFKSESQPLQYNHKIHTGEQAGISCEDCHVIDTDGRFHGIPTVAKCAECHSSQLGTSENEKILVEQYVLPNLEIPWRIYSLQPDNAYFSHVTHVRLGQLKCEECHGTHGSSEQLRIFQVNRISGYSRDIWNASFSGMQNKSREGMKMDDCIQCHEQRGRKDGCIACHK
ncbi:MAG: cytochrome c3 family protein [Bacteroidota bacterium]|nr:cytochrome c3 family protein [Bacteroidota bacterium]